MESLMTMKKACEFLNISRDTMERLLKDFKIPGAKIGGRWKFEKSDLQNYVNSKKIKVKKFAA